METLLALRTTERFFPSVDTLHVSLQITYDIETGVTLFTTVGFLSSVDMLMSRKVA